MLKLGKYQTREVGNIEIFFIIEDNEKFELNTLKQVLCVSLVLFVCERS